MKVIIIEPAVIDFYVESENKNLNWLEADKTVDLIDEASSSLRISLENMPPELEETYRDVLAPLGIRPAAGGQETLL